MSTRYGLIGTGHRSQMYIDAITGPHADVAELVALFDTNPGRMQWYREHYEALEGVPAVGPEHLEDVIAEQGIERMIVTSMDRFHAEHIVRSLEAGADVVVEKPLTIDAEKARMIEETVRRTGRSVTVTFNYRYSPRNSALREVIADGRIGTPVSMVFEWVLDTAHGADYFRRWHRDKANSGGLFVHKASHHFDLASWWIDAQPRTVYARGGVRFYGDRAAQERGEGPAAERGTHDGPHGPFELDLRSDPRLKELYLDQEQHDGYRRDQDVFAPGVTTEDNLTAIVDFDSGLTLTYALNAHSPWEGYRVAVNGTEGRVELEVVERTAVLTNTRERGESDGATEGDAVVDPSAVRVDDEGEGARRAGERLVLQRHFETAQEIEIAQGEGAHGGGDALMLAEVFRGRAHGEGTDPLGRAADWHDGLRAISIGICGNASIETGQAVDVEEFMGIGR
ncbi:Gfo/Idh/MocA family protein [Brachybacterium kimchii]|uniref:Gfo/Idh/MocA family oxidoreductase n=1 Tax=Brachybacterium kimchii TaxID=2942909 RepID=A0ABY4N3D1_9MICO|nr:Gfo/Idh/MocA family oxidoreductase [Brachybacterium kimchii]UQN28361.1 Gfo/Idh/MocA family oxidoreductase [Brachybacterium kimchii]